MFYLKKIVHHKALLENPGIDQPQLKSVTRSPDYL